MDQEVKDKQTTGNILIVATVDLTLATIGIMLDIFVLSEGKAGLPYKINGKLYQGNLLFYFAWGLIFIILLAQGLMAINLFTASSKFPITPLKSFKKITSWQIWSIGFLIVMIGGGVPTFALSSQLDDYYGVTIAYLIVEISFRLVAVVIVEFNRDLLKRDTFFPRVLPRSVSMASSNTKGAAGLPAIPFYANIEAKPSAPPPADV